MNETKTFGATLSDFVADRTAAEKACQDRAVRYPHRTGNKVRHGALSSSATNIRMKE